MPGRTTHQLAGAIAGVGFAALDAKNQPTPHFCIEMIGGGFGGAAAGMLPDWLEPAVCSWHRGVCHSATAGGAVLYAKATLAQWAQSCRENADQSRVVPQILDVHTGEWLPMPQTPLQKFWAEFCEFVWRFLAGFLNGLAAGYVSHLLLDASTPRGIPLFA